MALGGLSNILFPAINYRATISVMPTAFFRILIHRNASSQPLCLKSYSSQEIATSHEGYYYLQKQNEVLLAMTVSKFYPYPSSVIPAVGR